MGTYILLEIITDSFAQFQKHGLNVDVMLAAALEERHLILSSQSGPLLFVHHAQRVVGVTFVANQYFDSAR